MVIIAQSRNLPMKDVLRHPLGPLPWALATDEGSLRKTNKSALARELQKNVPVAESIPEPSACIIDGMSLVQKTKGDHRTFAEVADCILSSVINDCPASKRVDEWSSMYTKRNPLKLWRG